MGAVRWRSRRAPPLGWPLLAGAPDASLAERVVTDETQGAVEDFDEHRGDGHVVTDDGRRVWFHCTAIADGSRTIASGTKVRFVIQPGLPGQWEAVELRPA